MQEKISFNETVFFDKIKIALQRLESDTDAKLRSLMTSEANSKTVTDFGDPIKKFKDIVKIYGINGATVSKKDFPDEIYAAVMQRVVAVEAPKFSGGSLNEGYIIKQLGAYISDLLDTKTETITVGNKNYTLSNPIGSTLSTITVTVNDAHYVFSWNDDATARKSLNIFIKNLAEFEKEQLTSIFFAILKDAKKFTASSDGNSSDTLSKWLNALMHGRKTKSLSNLNGFEYFRQLSLVTKSTSVPGELISLVTDVFDTLKPALEVYGKLKSPNKQAKKLLETIESVRGTAESVKKFMSFTKDIFTDNGGTISSLIDKYDNLLEKTTTLAAYIDEHEISSAETLAASSAYKNFVKAFNNLESVAGASTTSFAVVLDECKICEFSDVTTAEISQNRALINGNGDDNNILSKGTSVTLNGNAGDDTLMTSGGYACVNGGDGADSIISEGRYSEINGDAGNDFIQIKGNGSSVNGGTGTDTLLIDAANVTVDGGTNFDFLPVPDKIIVGSNAEDLLIKNFEYADTLDLSEYKIGELSAGKYQTNSLEIWSRTNHKTIAILEDVTGGTDNNILCTGNDYLFTAVSLDWLLANTPTIANPYSTLKSSSVVNVPINGTFKNTFDNVLVYAQSGNNYIFNKGDNVTIAGGTDNDIVWNRGGSNVTISGGAGNDSILVSGAGNDSVVVDSGAGNDSISNYSSFASIDSGDGDDSIYNDGSYVTIDCGKGNDTLINNGYISHDVYYAYGYLNSNVLFKYSSGDGNDKIYGFRADSTLSISGAAYSSVVSGNDLILTVGNGKITLYGAATLSSVHIDGTLTTSSANVGLTADSTVSNTIISGTSYADSIKNTGNKVTINANADNDTINNVGSSVRIDAGNGNDRVYNNSTGVFINGNEDDDYIENGYYGIASDTTIDGGTGNDTIWNGETKVSIKGNDGNDSIYSYAPEVTIGGGAGSDTLWNDWGQVVLFKYAAGDGNDTIQGFNASSTLQISGSEYSSAISGDDVIITVGDGSILLVGAKDMTINIETVEGADNTILTLDNKTSATVELKASEEIANASKRTKPIQLTGNARNNELIGGNGNDTLDGAGGNNTLTSGKGKDTFIYNGGKDIITDYDKKDKIDTGSLAHEGFTVDGKDLIFNFGDGKALTLQDGVGEVINMNSNSNVYTSDGILDGKKKEITLLDTVTTFDATSANVYSKAVTIDASAASNEISITGNKKKNYIVAGANGATLNGGKGNDTLVGGVGADIFVYENKSGKDVIKGFGDGDSISLTGAEIKDAKVKGDNATIKLKGGALTINGTTEFSFMQDGAEKKFSAGVFVEEDTAKVYGSFKGSLKLADHDVANFNGSLGKKKLTITGDDSSNSLVGGKGKDSLNGGAGADSLWGGKGNDTLLGGDGDDTFIFNAGGGKDIIADYTTGDMIKILDKKGGDGSFTKATFKDDSLTLNVKGGGKVIVSGVNFSTVVNINSTNQTVSNLINSL